MLNKIFFIRYSNRLVKQRIRTQVAQYPNENELEEKIKYENLWKLFKTKTLLEIKPIENFKIKSKSNKNKLNVNYNSSLNNTNNKNKVNINASANSKNRIEQKTQKIIF